MVALPVVVLDVLLDRIPKVPLAQWNHLVEALRFDREYESFGVGIQIRTSRRQSQGLYAATAQDAAEALGEQRVAVENEVTFAEQETVEATFLIYASLGWQVIPAM